MSRYIGYPDSNSEVKRAGPVLPSQTERLPRLSQSTLDCTQDGLYVSAFEQAVAVSELKSIAIEAALREHPVTASVLRGKCEPSCMHPAISDTYQSIAGRKKNTRRRSSKVFEGPEEIPFISWSLPMQEKGEQCGIIRSDVKDITFKGCTRDPTEYSKALVNHCWRLACANCGNSTALRMGIRAEQKVTAPIDIIHRKTGILRPFKHWVISPPQEWISRIVQRADHFTEFYDDLVKLVRQYGMDNGLVVFHPWRWSTPTTEWVFGPHFHIVATGRVDNGAMRDYLDGLGFGGWVIKQVHSGEAVRSVRHTVAYLLTHAGLGTYTHSVNWDDEAEDLLHPIYKKGVQEFYKTISKYDYDFDYEATGLMDEHLDRVDWTEWAVRSVTAKFQAIRYFGLCNKTRILGIHAERVPSVCPVCGEAVGLYHSISDHDPEPVEYYRKSTVRIMAEDFDEVSSYYNDNREALEASGNTLLNFAMGVPQCSTPESMGVQIYQSKTTVADRATSHEFRSGLTVVYDIMPYGGDTPLYMYKPVIIPKSQASEFRLSIEARKIALGITGVPQEPVLDAQEHYSQYVPFRDISK